MLTNDTRHRVELGYALKNLMLNASGEADETGLHDCHPPPVHPPGQGSLKPDAEGQQCIKPEGRVVRRVCNPPM